MIPGGIANLSPVHSPRIARVSGKKIHKKPITLRIRLRMHCTVSLAHNELDTFLPCRLYLHFPTHSPTSPLSTCCSVQESFSLSASSNSIASKVSQTELRSRLSNFRAGTISQK